MIFSRTAKVGELSNKVQESRLKWYGHEKRREILGKRVMVVEVPGKIWRGRPKRRWLDNIRRNNLLERDCQGRKRNAGVTN